MENEDEQDIICPICFDDIYINESDHHIKLDCNHYYCHECFSLVYLNQNELEIKEKCCYCRSTFIYNITLNNYPRIYMKCILNLIINFILKYTILLFYILCFILHALSFLMELKYTQYNIYSLFIANNVYLNLAVNILNFSAILLLMFIQSVLFASVDMLYNKRDINFIQKIPSYFIFYMSSITLVYLNLRII